MAETYCESCAESGMQTRATTRSTNPDWSGYVLCEACAAELDTRPPVVYREEDDID